MYDSVTWQAIPADAEVVAGYIDGAYAWPQEAWDSFPDAMHVAIAVFPSTNSGDVLDCETGDATPEQCPDWIKMRKMAGIAVPTIYCNASTMPAVQQACQGLTYNLWIADWTGVPHLYPGSVATQYADPPLSGGNYDVSLCVPFWPEP